MVSPKVSSTKISWTLRCRKCGHVFESMMAVTPRCPKCGSFDCEVIDPNLSYMQLKVV